ncbi:MAG: macro domain-containing protein [Actinobacteria bacterium]|nr:macro domain-containing protein [Actinomycetota bacterium]
MEQHAQSEIRGTVVRVVEADLTAFDADVVVNAANRHLQHGGGLAGALSAAGGPQVQRASDAWVDEHGPLGPDDAAVTTAGTLPAQQLVHVAGPVYEEGSDQNEPLLRRAVGAALRAAARTGAQRVALPAISAGIYGYPLDEATAVIAHEVVRLAPDLGLAEVVLVGFDDETATAFGAGLERATLAG